MSIKVQNLLKTYGSQKAVNDISFSLNSGEIVGFLGPNGAGKSTTMKIITGFLDSDAGGVEVCGTSVKRNEISTKKKIGYLPEANPLYSDMYIREYLQFIGDVHEISNPKQRIEEVIKTVGLTIEANKKIGQLSKGYKQRVGLAAALLHDPEVLILDEPTTGLDPNQILEIRELIRALGRNKTVLFSSHIMQEVEAVCDRVIVIHKGRIVADDSLANLRKGISGNESVQVEFNEAVDRELLAKVKGVTRVTAAHGNSFELECKDPDVLKKDLLQWSIQNHYNIRSLQTGNQSLESVFKSLTT